jgi:hypothetical protein
MTKTAPKRKTRKRIGRRRKLQNLKVLAAHLLGARVKPKKRR